MRIPLRVSIGMVLPAVVIYGLFILYPTVRGASLSLTNSTGAGNGNFVGLTNYHELLADDAVRAALWNTVKFTMMTLVGQLGLALVFAAVLNGLPRVRSAVRLMLLTPTVFSVVVVGYVWSVIYSPIDGPLNEVLARLGLVDLQQIWLGDARTALPAVAVAAIWMYVGYSTAIFLANYAAIPPELFEAAALDGASPLQRFRYLDLRLLAPSITINVALTTIGALRVFEFPLVMTNGGPANATQSLTMLIYEQSFSSLRFGYGTAIAMVLLVLTVVVSLFQVVMLRRREVAL